MSDEKNQKEEPKKSSEAWIVEENFARNLYAAVRAWRAAGKPHKR